jgi:hypothetical protein
LFTDRLSILTLIPKPLTNIPLPLATHQKRLTDLQQKFIERKRVTPAPQ